MLKKFSLVILEQNPETGRMEPVPLAQVWEETVGYTVPPPGMPAMFREQWNVIRKRLIAQGKPIDSAWARASEAMDDQQAMFRERARKRFFRA
jgi:hypothetical protein